MTESNTDAKEKRRNPGKEKMMNVVCSSNRGGGDMKRQGRQEAPVWRWVA